MNAAGARYRRRPHRLGILAFAVILIFGHAPLHAAAPISSMPTGKRLVDGHGDTFAIKGINLGNWLVPEGYMFKFKQALSPSEISDFFDALIGREAAARFWTEFRDVYITKEDIGFIKAAGFNTVRVPLELAAFRLIRATPAAGVIRSAGLVSARPAHPMVPASRPARDRRSARRAGRADRRQSR